MKRIIVPCLILTLILSFSIPTIAQYRPLIRHGRELFSNTGFEIPGAGGADVFNYWSESAGNGAIAMDTTPHSGIKSCKLTAGATTNTYVYSRFTGATALTQNGTYQLSFWTRGDGTNAGRYQVYDVTHSTDIIAKTSTGITGTTWTQISTSFTVPVGCLSLDVYFYCPDTNTGIAYFDDASLSL